MPPSSSNPTGGASPANLESMEMQLNNFLALTILSKLQTLESKVDKIMATEADLEKALADMKTDFDAHVAADAASRKAAADALAALQAQIASLQASQPVSQAQLDALVANATAIDEAIKAAPTS